MTKQKQVAKTLKSISSNPIVSVILDKTADIRPVIEKVQKYWGYDLFSRTPGAAYRDGVFVGTDLDLAAFLYALIGREAAINIPRYKSMREKNFKSSEIVTSKENRHGHLVSLVSNKETFIFSIRIRDMNIMNAAGVGDYRTFSLTGFDGTWYDGWDTLQFIPSAKENDFLKKTDILTDGSIVFSNFIHPNRWTSMYGQYYFITKLLIDRLTAESSHYFSEIKRMIAEGVEYPEAEAPTVWESPDKKGETKSIKVQAFNAEVDYPADGSEFPVYENTQENLVMLTKKRKDFVYKTTPHLRFMTRATEQAFATHINTRGLDSMPSWLKDVKWEEGYKQKGKRTLWNRLVYFQPGVGETGVALRFRQYEKSERVDIDYQE